MASRIEIATRLAYNPVELDDAARAKSEETLKEGDLLEGVDRSKCWYCEEGKATHEIAAPLTRPSKIAQGIEHMLIGVPACQSCRNLFVSRKSIASMLMNGILVPFSVGGLLLGINASRELYEKDGLSLRILGLPLIGLLMGLGLSVFLAAFITTAVCSSRFKRAESLRNASEYPPIKRLQKDGWQP